MPLATVGTAGETDGRPFRLLPEAFLACWPEAAEEPATVAGEGPPVTTSGVEAGFFVAPAAEAYEGAVEADVVGAGVVVG